MFLGVVGTVGLRLARVLESSWKERRQAEQRRRVAGPVGQRRAEKCGTSARRQGVLRQQPGHHGQRAAGHRCAGHQGIDVISGQRLAVRTDGVGLRLAHEPSGANQCVGQPGNRQHEGERRPEQHLSEPLGQHRGRDGEQQEGAECEGDD